MKHLGGQAGLSGTLCIAIILIGCREENGFEAQIDLHARAEQYFAIYSERRDWEGFLSFYQDTMEFRDDAMKTELQGKQEFAKFYNWPDPRFELVDADRPALVVNELIVDGRTAVARGHFAPFRWDGKLQHWKGEFVIWLKFNDRGKIVSQRDYIPYPRDLLPE